MPDVYRSADIFCLPSWWEAMPLSVLEAMASGLPVVATTVGDVPTMVRPGVTGFLVEPRNLEAIAASLRTLLDDPDLRRRMGSAGREEAERNFGADGTIARLDEVYEQTSRLS
jgi:glycosyltransferase involved in cell wall biosynthesis